MTITLIATTTMGFETPLAYELKALEVESPTVKDTKVEFEAPENFIPKANLWLRTAGRVYLKIAEFPAKTFDELFENTKSQNWAKWITKDGEFPVSDISSKKSELFSKRTCQGVIKKAIVESLKKAHKTTDLPETGPKFPIRAWIDKDIVTLAIDTTGEGLHKRGYRAHMDIAPLRETLAAGLLNLARWRPDKDPLLDPLCGSGTLLIEAGLIAKNIAPGLNRNFLSETWPTLKKSLWEEEKATSKAAIHPNPDYHIEGSDTNQTALKVAEKNIALAGLKNIKLEKKELRNITPTHPKGKIITNPPYADRLGEMEEVETLYQTMGNTFKSKFPEWSTYIITPHDDFQTLYGAKSTKHRKLFNGGKECYFYQYHN